MLGAAAVELRLEGANNLEARFRGGLEVAVADRVAAAENHRANDGYRC